MAQVTDQADLFEYQLNLALQSEKAIERTLPKLAKEANNDELRRGFEHHLEETRGHVDNLEQAIERVGARRQATTALVTEALGLQHKAFAADAGDTVLPDILDLVAVGSAAATEHYEIATYESLISLAQSLGAKNVIPLLEENLRQERNMLEQTKKIGEQIGRQASGELEQALRPVASQQQSVSRS